MSDLSSVYMALQKADAAGDTQGAKVLADYIRTQSAGDTAKTPMEQLDQINGAQRQAEPEPSDNASLWDKNMAVLNTARGVVQNGLVAPLANATGAASELIGRFGGPVAPGTAEAVSQAVMNRFGHQPDSPLGAQYTQNAGNALDASKLAGLPVMGNELGLLGQATKDAIQVPPNIIAKGLSNTIGRGVDKIMPSPNITPGNLTKNATASEARNAGYTLPPSVADSGAGSRVLEGISGTAKTKQLSMIKNQPMTDELARQAIRQVIDVPENAPVTKALTAEARAKAYTDGYEPIANAGEMSTDPTYTSDLNKILARFQGAARSFPQATRDDVAKLVDGHQVSSFDAGDALMQTQVLRDAANEAFTKGDTGIAKANRAVAKAIEDQIERSLMTGGADSAAILQKFREARSVMAQTHEIDKALNPANAHVDANVLGAAFKKGAPLTGPLLTIGKTAAAFPEVMGVPKAGYSNPLTAVDSLSGLLTGAAAGAAFGGPMGMMAATVPSLARIGSRFTILSGQYQKSLAARYGIPEVTSSLPSKTEIADQGLSLVPFEPSGAGYQGPNQSLGLVPRGTPTPTGASDPMRAPSAPDLELGPGGSRRPELDIQGIKESLGVQRAFDVAHAQADRKSGGAGLNLSDARAGGTASQAGTHALSPQSFTFYNAEIKNGSMTQGERVEVVNPEQTGMITDPFGNEVPSVMARFVDRKGSPQFVVPQNLLSTLSRPHSPRFAQDIAETTYGPPAGIGLSAAQPQPRVAGQRISPPGIGLSKP